MSGKQPYVFYPTAKGHRDKSNETTMAVVQ
jgi:hypothetical protein